jgi:hypothetical protein
MSEVKRRREERKRRKERKLKGLWLREVEREKGERGDVKDKVWGDLSDKSSQVAAMQKESKYQFPDDAFFSRVLGGFAEYCESVFENPIIASITFC